MRVDPDVLERWTNRMVSFRTFRRDGSRGDESFREATDRALGWLEAWARDRDLAVDNWRNRVLRLTVGRGDPHTALVGHVDVVPPGEASWEQDDPFRMEADETDGGRVLKGRGVVDDKGPLAALMWVMQQVAGDVVPAPGRVSLIVDTAEEVGFENLRNYLEEPAVETPDRSLVADGFFPFVAGEKGRLAFRVTLCPAEEHRTAGSYRLIELEGGRAVNQVPDRAAARIRPIDEGFPVEERLRSELPGAITERLTVRRDAGGDRVLTVSGDTAHAATPDEGFSAAAALFSTLERLPGGLGAWDPVIARLGSFVDGDGDFRHDGKPLGLTREDDRFPRGTTLNLGLVRFDPDGAGLQLDFDARLVPGRDPSSILRGTITERLSERMGGVVRFDVACLDVEAPLIVDPDRPLAAAAREAYREVTGRADEPVYTGGRTHATALPNAFTCGVMQPERFEWYGFHGVDERVYRHELADTARVYAALLEHLARGTG